MSSYTNEANHLPTIHTVVTQNFLEEICKVHKYLRDARGNFVYRKDQWVKARYGGMWILGLQQHSIIYWYNRVTPPEMLLQRAKEIQPPPKEIIDGILFPSAAANALDGWSATLNLRDEKA